MVVKRVGKENKILKDIVIVSVSHTEMSFQLSNMVRGFATGYMMEG